MQTPHPTPLPTVSFSTSVSVDQSVISEAQLELDVFLWQCSARVVFLQHSRLLHEKEEESRERKTYWKPEICRIFCMLFKKKKTRGFYMPTDS